MQKSLAKKATHTCFLGHPLPEFWARHRKQLRNSVWSHIQASYSTAERGLKFGAFSAFPSAGVRMRLASAGETPCSHTRKQPLFMEQLLKAEPHDDDAIPLYDYSFSAASNAAPHKGGDATEVSTTL